MRDILNSVSRFFNITTGSLLAMGTLMLLSSQAYAQSCEAISKAGMYDTEISTNSVDQTEAFRTWFCQSEFSSHKEFLDFGLKLALPIPDLPVELGFNATTDNWAEWKRSVCSETQRSTTFHQRSFRIINVISGAMARALADCVNKVGLHAWLEMSEDPRVFTFNTVFTPPSSALTQVRVRSFTVTPASVRCDRLPSTIGPEGHEIICRRSNDAAVQVAFNANYRVTKDTPLRFPAITRVVPPDPTPTPAPPPVPQEEFVTKGKSRGSAVLTMQSCPEGFAIGGMFLPGRIWECALVWPASLVVEFFLWVKSRTKDWYKTKEHSGLVCTPAQLVCIWSASI